MATIDELEARAENIKACEHAAVLALADGMRELAVSLPDGSRLATDFAAEARAIERWAGGLDPSMAFFPMQSFVRRVYKEWKREGRLA